MEKKVKLGSFVMVFVLIFVFAVVILAGCKHTSATTCTECPKCPGLSPCPSETAQPTLEASLTPFQPEVTQTSTPVHEWDYSLWWSNPNNVWDLNVDWTIQNPWERDLRIDKVEMTIQNDWQKGQFICDWGGSKDPEEIRCFRKLDPSGNLVWPGNKVMLELVFLLENGQEILQARRISVLPPLPKATLDRQDTTFMPKDSISNPIYTTKISSHIGLILWARFVCRHGWTIHFV